jgi:hypothetical protein
VHFEVRILSQRIHRHERSAIGELEPLLGAAIAPALPAASDQRLQLVG